MRAADNQASIAELETQVDGLREIFIEFDDISVIKRDLRRLITRDNKASEGEGLLLVAPSGGGKTKLIESLRDEMAERDAKEPWIIREDGNRARRLSMACTTVPEALASPASSVKNLSENVLSVLSDGHGVVTGDRRVDFDKGIKHYAQERETGLLVLDEGHQGLLHAEWIATKIKDYSNMARFSLLLSGTKDVEKLLHAKEELVRRFPVRREIRPLDIRTQRGRSDCRELLATIDDHLREAVFGQSSGLAATRLVPRIWFAGMGVIGQMATLIQQAAMLAVYDMVEGNGRGITDAHLGRAYDAWPFGRGRPNPFRRDAGPFQAVLPVPSKDGLGGRRAARDRNFRS